MKNKLRRMVLASFAVSALLLSSCESNEVLPKSLASDPPGSNSPQKPPQP